MPTVRSRREEYKRELMSRLEARMFAAMTFLEGDVKRSISTGQPIRRTRGGRLIGLNPSRPGHPPHVLTGRLRQSITGRARRAGDFIIGTVGSSVKYARALEFGYPPRHLDPRPYLRPALKRNLRKIGAILRGGV